MSNLTDIARELHAARMALMNAKEAHDVALEAFQSSPAYLQYQRAKEHVGWIEETLRKEIEFVYAETGAKKLAPGLGVRVSQILFYDQEQAFAWAQNHKLALQLDKKAFEKIAKADPPEFVFFEEKITPTIASDLSEYLETPNGS